jgi:hypothetical protein
MGSQVPSPNIEAKSQLSSLKKPIQCGLYSLKSDLDYFMRVLRIGSSFVLTPTLNTSLQSHLQKVLPCRHPCHTRDLGLGTRVKW